MPPAWVIVSHETTDEAVIKSKRGARNGVLDVGFPGGFEPLAEIFTEIEADREICFVARGTGARAGDGDYHVKRDVCSPVNTCHVIQ